MQQWQQQQQQQQQQQGELPEAALNRCCSLNKNQKSTTANALS